MNQVFALHGVALNPQLRNHFLHIDCVPDNDGVGEQVQAAHHLLLGFFLAFFPVQHFGPHPAPAQSPGLQRVVEQFPCDALAQFMVCFTPQAPLLLAGAFVKWSSGDAGQCP